MHEAFLCCNITFPCEVTLMKTEIKAFLLLRRELFTWTRSIHTQSNDRRLGRGPRDGWWCRISNVNVRTWGEQLHRVQRQPLQQKKEDLPQTASKKRQDEEKKLSCKLLSVTAVPVFSPSKSSITIKVLIVFKGKCRESLPGLKSQPPVCPIQLQTGHQTSMLSFLRPWGSCQCYFALPDTLQWTWQSSTLIRVSYGELLRWTSRGAAIKLSPQLHHHRADCHNQANQKRTYMYSIFRFLSNSHSQHTRAAAGDVCVTEREREKEKEREKESPCAGVCITSCKQWRSLTAIGHF